MKPIKRPAHPHPIPVPTGFQPATELTSNGANAGTANTLWRPGVRQRLSTHPRTT